MYHYYIRLLLLPFPVSATTLCPLACLALLPSLLLFDRRFYRLCRCNECFGAFCLSFRRRLRLLLPRLVNICKYGKSVTFCFRFASSFAAFSCGLKKYSPDSSCKSILRGGCGGGNGVYTFFLGFSSVSNPAAFLASSFFAWASFFRAVFSEVVRCRFRNVGRNRSHDSFASLGSFASSRLIMSSWLA